MLVVAVEFFFCGLLPRIDERRNFPRIASASPPAEGRARRPAYGDEDDPNGGFFFDDDRISPPLAAAAALVFGTGLLLRRGAGDRVDVAFAVAPAAPAALATFIFIFFFFAGDLACLRDGNAV